MEPEESIPDDVVLERRTAEWDQETIPNGLLRAHRIAAGVWGRLVVTSGAVELVFEDTPARSRRVTAPGAAVIPPDRPHHLRVIGPVTCHVEFHVAGDEE